MSDHHLGRFRGFSAAARVIGRRNALRYLALGAGSALVAACGSGGGSGRAAAAGDTGAPSPAAPPSSAPATTATASASAKPTVAERAFDAFVRGSWTVRSTTSRGKSTQGTVTVRTDGGGNGGWTIAWEGASGKDATWRGSFLLRGGHLSLTLMEGPNKLVNERPPEALQVPGTVGESVRLALPWTPPGAGAGSSGETLDVSYSGDVLRIVHTAGHSPTTHVCTRA
ncbi:hypothetical protein ACFWP2_19715 [Kitasatospora sp. NPDC058444]|uniref:hypothetical protein n=1 Tax=Kitasatospora sp. NPDC058444 TaxID=3346504 RepID=UPI003657D181